ncbi:MAG: EamA family transporter [Proteobacteria bacterium]|nr:EamA family transporter [Pseudomonadota bacterium]
MAVMTDSRHSARGIALVLLAAMLWGTTGTAQSLAPATLSPYWAGALRLVIASGFFALLAWRAPGRVADWPWGRMALAGGCIAAYNLSFFAGVRLSGVALGTAIAIGSGPIWAGLLQTLVARRLPPALWWLGTLVSVAGGAAMALGQGGGLRLNATGVALCLLAGLAYATYTLVNKDLVLRLGPARTNLAVFAGAALLSVPVAWALGGPLQAGAGIWGVVLFLGLVSTGLSYLLFSSGLRHISGTTGVTLALGEPVTAFVLAVWVVGERQQPLAYLGLAGVIAGLLLVVWAELRA